jgi:WD40 repeat protein
MIRLLSGIALFLAIVETLPAAPVPVVPNDPTKDREGNPLPKGATARLGSLCYRGITTSGLTFSSDGKKLFAVQHDRAYRWGWDPDSDEKKLPAPQNGRLYIWDADTGRLLTTKPIDPGVSPNSSVSTCVVGNRIITIASELGNPRKNEDSSVKVIVASVADGKEISHFEFPGSQERSWREYEFGETGYGGAFPTAAVSPDGNYLSVVSARENAVLVFDINSGKMLHSKGIETLPQAGVYITPDSKTLFVREDNKPLVRYELVSGKPLPAFADTELFIHSLAISSDGKRAITGGYAEVKDPDQPRFRNHKSENFLVVRDATTGKPIGKLPIGRSIHAFQFVGSDAILVSSSTSDLGVSRSSISRWNIVELKREWEKLVPRGVWTSPLKVSPDGKRFNLAGSHMISLCDSLTGKPVIPTATHSGSVRWVAFSSDGKTVTTAGGEELFVWAINGERKQLLELPELSRGRGFIPSGLSGDHLVWVSSSEDGKTTELVGWDREKTQIGWRLPLPGKQPANVFSHDGKRVIALNWEEKWDDWQASVYDGPTGKTIDDWSVPNIPPKISQPGNLNALRNELMQNQFRFGQGGGGKGGGKGGAGGGGRGGAGGGMGGGLGGDTERRLVELFKSIEQNARTGPDWCHAIALSGDGNTIFVAGEKVIGLDPIRGKKKVRLDPGLIESIGSSTKGPLAASADGSRLAVGDQHSLRIYDVKTGKQLLEQPGSFLGAEMKFSPTADRLVVWSHAGTKVSIYSIDSNAKPQAFDGGLSTPTCAAFSPTGTSLAVGYLDGTTLIWDLAAKP